MENVLKNRCIFRHAYLNMFSRQLWLWRIPTLKIAFNCAWLRWLPITNNAYCTTAAAATTTTKIDKIGCNLAINVNQCPRWTSTIHKLISMILTLWSDFSLCETIKPNGIISNKFYQDSIVQMTRWFQCQHTQHFEFISCEQKWSIFHLIIIILQ